MSEPRECKESAISEDVLNICYLPKYSLLMNVGSVHFTVLDPQSLTKRGQSSRHCNKFMTRNILVALIYTITIDS